MAPCKIIVNHNLFITVQQLGEVHRVSSAWPYLNNGAHLFVKHTFNQVIKQIKINNHFK